MSSWKRNLETSSVMMDNSEKRIDVVAFLTYKGSELRLWIAVTERMDVGCVIEAKIYHKMDESAEADE